MVAAPTSTLGAFATRQIDRIEYWRAADPLEVCEPPATVF
ncbi:hypothetical protein BN938_0461 [Mucinivorans hirudinis]|uniref:Uncharacterized protein n=1 Tax=Mucinivorans hirudinis TaxID=1433126 RepID=A0A060R6B0_9BACT|nr:hypothetical protein BN938_0087 [Mucinivorans hirudinis]CDN30566.1 hypothetical protein BN938_0461 [Mucinivorans hirudinis]